MHWLHRAAERACLRGLDALDLPIGAPAAEAWARIEAVAALGPVELSRRLAAALRIAAAELDGVDLESEPLIPDKLARKYHVIALRRDERTITVATADPMDMEAEQALSFATGRRVIFELAAPSAIEDAMSVTTNVERAVSALLSKVGADDAENVRLVEETSPEQISRRDVDAAPIVKLASLMLSEAVAQGASDIHIEPGSGRLGVVRFRIDGVMRPYLELPPSAITRIVSRIKVLAKLDIADRMRPQDGRARIQVRDRTYDLRVSTVPTREAEKAVVRILRPDTMKALDGLELLPEEMARLRQILSYRDGLVVLTGPTGSGKTTTLYAAVRELANGSVNVMTVEDPVEYEMAGVTQLQVDVKKGLTFASALRSILRQDPDVILVGEIRDAETASIAAQAAMTGHLVLATLHTNDAMSIVTRLVELGVDRPTIAAILRGSIAQRLIRKLCVECAEPIVFPLFSDEERLMRQYGVSPNRRATGCRRCATTGYQGRLAIVEVAVVTPSLAEQIVRGDSAASLQRSAMALGMKSLRNVALEWAARGETTLQEVERVLGDVAPDTSTEHADLLTRISMPLDFGTLARQVPELPPLPQVSEVSEVSEVADVAVPLPRVEGPRERRGGSPDRRSARRPLESDPPPPKAKRAPAKKRQKKGDDAS